MNITTLKYIHQLLVDEEKRTNEIYKNARKVQYTFEENEEPDIDLIKSQTEAADEYMKEHSNALNALQDFEQQEW